MKKEEIFYSMESYLGKIDVLKIQPYHIWKAEKKQELDEKNEFSLLPYILVQILIIDGKKTTIDELSTMELYLINEITDVITPMFININKI